MKRLIITLFYIIVFSLNNVIIAQSPFKGFWRPLNRSVFQSIETIDRGIKVDETTSLWLMRPVIELSALQFMLTNPIQVSSLTSLGTGLSYQHIINANGKPYTNFGLNALILFTNKVGGIEPASLSFAVTGSFLQYLNVGGGYSLQAKKFFILSGVTYNFN